MRQILIGAALSVAATQASAEPTTKQLALQCAKLARYVETMRLPNDQDDQADIALCNAVASVARETAFAAWNAYTGKKCQVGGLEPETIATSWLDFVRETPGLQSMRGSQAMGIYANTLVKMMCEKAAAR